jgi:3-hydroxybutyryl-CoA dehydratase
MFKASPENKEKKHMALPELSWSEALIISATDQESFRHLSGDTNLIHHNAAFAKQRGFTGPVVFGGLLVTKLSGFLGTIFPGEGCVWSKLAIDFRAPLYVDEVAILAVDCYYSNEDLGIWELSLRVNVDTKVVAVGSAQVLRPKVR